MSTQSDNTNALTTTNNNSNKNDADYIHLPDRPGFGTKGRAIALRANHFAIDLHTGAIAKQKLSLYDVQIDQCERVDQKIGKLTVDEKTKTANKQRKPPPSSQDKVLPRRLCRFIIRDLSLREKWQAVAYDGAKGLFAKEGTVKNAETKDGVQFTVKRPSDCEGDTTDEFKVRIKYTTSVDVAGVLNAFCSAQRKKEEVIANIPYATALQALDAVMRHERASDPAWIVAGRAFLDSKNKKPLSSGFEIWLGYSLSARPTQGGTHLVVDRAAGAFIAPMPAVERLCVVLDRGGGGGGRGGAGGGRGGSGGRGARPEMPRLPLQAREFKEANAAFKGIKVRLTHFSGQKRQKLLRGLSKQSAEETYFKDDKGGKLNVVQYFKSQYNITLKYPKLPCVVSGTADKPIYFPMEVCDVLEQRQRLLTDAKATADMIRATAAPPNERRKAIEDTVKRDIAHQDAISRVGFGVNISKEMVKVEGRVLQPPVVTYKGGKTLQPKAGAWNLIDHVLLNPPSQALTNWAIVTFDHTVTDGACKDLAKMIKDGMQKFGGMSVSSEASLDRPNRNEPPENVIHRVANRGAKLIICIMSPFDNKTTYNAVKSAAELDIGVQTQCLINKWRLGQDGGGKQGGPNHQFIANLVQKINAKLGGRNSKVLPANTPLMQIPTLIFGADVSHAAPGSSASSIASVVGSYDQHCGRYISRLSAQASRQEIIEDLEQMAYEIMQSFFKLNGGGGNPSAKPQRIIFYRDGVSEGQFQAVLSGELPALRRAFARLGDGTYNPPVTYIVAQKRHNTRLFVDDLRDGEGKNNCVPAGTVVDKSICHPREHDFYLQAHSGIQGTTRPVHYHVLADENSFGADAIQGLTFALSHLYCRCTRSVSLVPPVYYAHLSAARGAQYEKAKEMSETASVMSTKTGASDAPPRSIEVNSKLNNEMYFV